MDLPSGRSGLHAQRPAVLKQYACACVFARTLLQLTEGKIVPVGDLKLSIVDPWNVHILLVNTFLKIRKRYLKIFLNSTKVAFFKSIEAIQDL